MQFDKDAIINVLEQRGDSSAAAQAAQQLPDQVDHEQHAGLLSQLGVDPQELVSKLGKF